MSDFSNEEKSGKSKFEQMTDKPFFTFSKPYLNFIDRNVIYSFVYFVMAVINLLLPFVILYTVIDSGFFQLGAKFVFAFVLSWLVIVFACWIGFQLWWNRRAAVKNIGASEFSVTLIFSLIIQTFGEWIGTLTGIIGAGAGLLASIFLGNDVNYLFREIGFGYLNFGVAVVIIAPVIGLSTIIIFRFLAEQLRIWASIAHNTGKIAESTKK
jgi:hypothetical protein